MAPPFDPKKLVAAHVASIPPSGIRDFFELVQTMPDAISLGVGEPDFVTPWHIREAAIYALEKGRTSYTSNRGLLKLREAISRKVEEEFGVAYDPEREILVTVGVSEALDLALRSTINPGDEVIYHEPCYVSYAPGITMAYGVARPVPCRAETNFSLSPEALTSVISSRSKSLVLNFPTNPTGGTLSRMELMKIADVALRHNLLVITDEIYSELTFEGEHPSIAALPGMRERTILLHGFSKAYAMTGFRVGFACAPRELIDAMTRVHQYTMLCASIVSQEAALQALRDGRPDTIEMREHYRARRNFLVQAFNAMGLPCHLPRGSFYAFPSIAATGLTSREFALELLREEKVACVPGSAFGPGGEGYLRCCFATALDKIEVAAERMARFMARKMGQ